MVCNREKNVHDPAPPVKGSPHEEWLNATAPPSWDVGVGLVRRQRDEQERYARPPEFIRIYKDPKGFLSIHKDSQGLTRTYKVSCGFTKIYKDSQGNAS